MTEASSSIYDDHRRPLIRGVRLGSIALVVITIASLALWGGLEGLPGIWGVLIGAALGGGFVLMTALSVLATSSLDPSMTMAVVLGGWLLKMVVVLIVIFAIRDLTFYHHLALFVTVVIALLVTLLVEVWGLITTRVTYVS